MTPDESHRPTPAKPPLVSLELSFDDELDAAVRAQWKALQDAGFSSLAAHTAPSNRPHVTVLARRHLAPSDPADFAGLLPLPITLGAPLLFGAGDRRVLARAVVPSRALVALHAAVHARAGADDDLPHTGVGEWQPHVTLARRLRLDQLAEALPLVGDELRGTVVGLRRWDSADKLVTALIGSTVSP